MRWRRFLFGNKEDPRKELAEIFSGQVPSGGGAPPEALKWARGVLRRHSAGTEAEAIRVLRKAEPRLSLKSAVYLVKQA